MEKPKNYKITQGQNAENAACEFLKQNGLKVVERNYRCKLGEIDIIADDGKCKVFVEVRYRKKATHGSSLDTITPQKLQKVIQSAQHYLLCHNLHGKIMHRVDVIGFEGNLDEPTWFKNITI